MAIPSIGALPSVPGALGADDEAQKEYMDALQRVMASLETRNQPNWFNIAGAFLNPGRTGSFGESLGRAADVVGQDIQKQQEQEPNIAMMRAQLAGQKYEVANQSKALGMLSNAFGMTPAATTEAINSGKLDPALIDQLSPGLYTTISLLYPKLGEVVKNAFGMQLDKAKFENEVNRGQTDAAKLVIDNGPGAIAYLPQQYTKSMPGGKPDQPTVQTGLGLPLPVEGGRISSPFGQRPNPFDKSKVEMHNGIDIAAPLGSNVKAVIPGIVKSAGDNNDGYGNRVVIEHPDGSLSYYSHLQSIDVAPGDKVTQGFTLGTVGQTGKATGPHVEFSLSNNGRPMDPTPLFQPRISQAKQGAQPTLVASADTDLTGVPLGKQGEIVAGRVKEADKPFVDKRTNIYAYTPQTLSDSNGNIKELDSIVTKYPKIVGMMQKEGLLTAIQAAAQEGATGSVGAASVNLSLPVQKFLEKYKLNPKEQEALSRVTQILGTEFLNNVRTNRGLLGVNPTDNDARLLQAPMPTVADSANAIHYWVRQQLVTNKQREALFNALSDHDTKVGTGASPSLFFKPGDTPYNKILNDFRIYRKQVQDRFGPTATQPQQ